MTQELTSIENDSKNIEEINEVNDEVPKLNGNYLLDDAMWLLNKNKSQTNS